MPELPFQPFLMVDSGAFSAHTQGKPIALDEYMAFCHKLQRKMPSAIYVNLDVISSKDASVDVGKLSYENWQTMKRNGLEPLPVFHLHTDLKWLGKYMAETDYIALGAVVLQKTNKRKAHALSHVWEQLVDKDRNPLIKVHGMGVTSFELMRNYPWFSIDSTSWLQAAIFGKVLIPHRKNGAWDYDRKPHVLDVSSKSPKVGDREHIKNLRPLVKQEVERYVRENDYELAALAEDPYARMCLNALFYTRFVRLLTWPRPLRTTSNRLIH